MPVSLNTNNWGTAGQLLVGQIGADGVNPATPSNPIPIASTGPAAGTAVATLTNVASLATSATVLAANAARRGAMIANDDANPLKIKYGATASATSYTVNIPSGGYWEMPQPIYAGIIDGIWDADGSGSARVTELT